MTSFESEWSVEQLVPHAGRMSLLGHVVSVAGEQLTAELTTTEHDLFFDAQGPGSGIGAWVGIEYMAQAVAAWAGWQARQQGGVPLIGFLLGSRRYQCSVTRFEAAQVLRVQVRREFQADNGLGQFDCRITCEGAELASAKLTVFGPSDPAKFLKGENSHE